MFMTPMSRYTDKKLILCLSYARLLVYFVKLPTLLVNSHDYWRITHKMNVQLGQNKHVL